MTTKLVEVQRFSVISAKPFKTFSRSSTQPLAIPTWPHFATT